MRVNIQITTAETDYKKAAYSVEIDCEKTAVPGLVVHKMIGGKDGNPVPIRKFDDSRTYWWSITHQVSGIGVIRNLFSRAQAREIAAKLSGLDWTVDVETLKKDKRYGKLVKVVKEAYQL